MKTSKDPRHKMRIKAVKQLFAFSYNDKQNIEDIAKKVYNKRDELDKQIEIAAPAWPIDKLNRIDLAILRLAVYELTNTDTPPKVVIDEAVELAKRYGSENSASFVNGVLGTILKSLDDGKQIQTD
jgi:transcription antitermination protein NusB